MVRRMYKPDLEYAQGIITTQNLNPLVGVPTPGSFVELEVEMASTLMIQTVGTYTGVLTVQCTINGTNWVTLGGTLVIRGDIGLGGASIPSAFQGIHELDVSGYSKVRVSALAAVTGSVTVTLRADDSASVVSLASSLPTGTGVLGQVQAAPALAVNVPETLYNLNAAAGTNSNLISAGAKRLITGVITNLSAGVKYVKLYNKATAPTVGTDSPVITIPLAAASIFNLTQHLVGLRFPLGLGIAITGLGTDADTTAVAAGDVKVMLGYL